MSTKFHKGCWLLERHRISDRSHVSNVFQSASHRVVFVMDTVFFNILEHHDILAVFVRLVCYKHTNISFLELLI